MECNEFNLLSWELQNPSCDVQKISAAWKSTFVRSEAEGIRQIVELLAHSTGRLQSFTIDQADKLTVETVNQWIPTRNVKPLILDKVYLKNIREFLDGILDDRNLIEVSLMHKLASILFVFSKSQLDSTRFVSLEIGSRVALKYRSLWRKVGGARYGCGTKVGRKAEELMVDFARCFDNFMQLVLVAVSDVNLMVRKNALNHLVSCMLEGDSLMMDKKYFDVVFWSLHDGCLELRIFALKAICSLLKFDVIKSDNEFLKRTYPFLLDRAQDIVKNVAITALEGLLELFRCGFVPTDHLALSMTVVFDTDKERYSKAVELLCMRIRQWSNNTVDIIVHTVACFQEYIVGDHGKYGDFDSVANVLVERIFPNLHQELGDWLAWRLVLKSNVFEQLYPKKEMLEPCWIFLLELIRYMSNCANGKPVTTSFPPVPSSCDVQIDEEAMVSGEPNQECLRRLSEMTLLLGDDMLIYWNKYKDNKICLRKLITIPQYFRGDIDTLDLDDIWNMLIAAREIFNDSPTLEATHHSMASLLKLMTGYPRWKPSIPKYEKMVFSKAKYFMKACSTVARGGVSQEDEMTNLKLIKQNFYLTKFFDVSETTLVQDNEPLTALMLGTSKNKVKLICPTITMCLYVLQWQLKNLIERDTARTLRGEEKMAVLNRIKYQSETLVHLLENQLRHLNSAIRDTSFSVLCRLLTIFCPQNVFLGEYGMLHLAEVSLITKEWLNFNLVINIPKSTVPTDMTQFELASSTLKLFSSLLTSQVLNLRYMSSILCYVKFSCYNRNYNNVLVPVFHDLAKNRNFPHQLIEILAWMNTNSSVDVEEVTEGLCAVVLPSLTNYRMKQMIAREIVAHGLTLVKSEDLLFILHLLTYFVDMLTKEDTVRFYNGVSQTFVAHLENQDVQTFLRSFEDGICRKNTPRKTPKKKSFEKKSIKTSINKFRSRNTSMNQRTSRNYSANDRTSRGTSTNEKTSWNSTTKKTLSRNDRTSRGTSTNEKRSLNTTRHVYKNERMSRNISTNEDTLGNTSSNESTRINTPRSTSRNVSNEGKPQARRSNLRPRTSQPPKRQ